MGFFKWLHRAWLGIAILFMLAAGVAWLEVNVRYRAQVIEQLCSYRDDLEAAFINLDDFSPRYDTADLLLKNMWAICVTRRPEER